MIPVLIAALAGAIFGGAVIAWCASLRIEDEAEARFAAGFADGYYYGELGDQKAAEERVRLLTGGAWALLRADQSDPAPAEELIVP